MSGPKPHALNQGFAVENFGTVVTGGVEKLVLTITGTPVNLV